MLESFRNCVDNPHIGLMGNQPADFNLFEAQLFQAVLAGSFHAANRVLENLIAGHLDIVLSCSHSLCRRGKTASSGRQDKQLRLLSVGTELDALNLEAIAL